MVKNKTNNSIHQVSQQPWKQCCGLLKHVIIWPGNYPVISQATHEKLVKITTEEYRWPLEKSMKLLALYHISLNTFYFPTYKKGENKSAFFSLVKWIGNGYLNYVNFVQGAFTPQKEPKIKKNTTE